MGSSGMDAYPTIAFIVRWGGPLAVAVAACLPLGALVLVAKGWSPLVLVAGAVAGLVAWALLRSYVEVLRVISDTLIPK